MLGFICIKDKDLNWIKNWTRPKYVNIKKI